MLPVDRLRRAGATQDVIDRLQGEHDRRSPEQQAMFEQHLAALAESGLRDLTAQPVSPAGNTDADDVAAVRALLDGKSRKR